MNKSPLWVQGERDHLQKKAIMKGLEEHPNAPNLSLPSNTAPYETLSGTKRNPSYEQTLSIVIPSMAMLFDFREQGASLDLL